MLTLLDDWTLGLLYEATGHLDMAFVRLNLESLSEIPVPEPGTFLLAGAGQSTEGRGETPSIQGWPTRLQLAWRIADAFAKGCAPMKKIGEVLLAAGQITETQLRSALGEQARWGNRIGETLVQLGYLQESELIRILSERLGCQGIDLSGREIHPDVIGLIPSEVAIKYACLPVIREPGSGSADVLYVAMEDPTNLTALDDVTFRTGCAVKPLLAGPIQLRRAISTCYESGPVEHTIALEISAEVAPAATVPDGSDQLSQEIWLDETDIPATASADSPAASSGGGSPGELSTRQLLQALTRLLLRKGILDREEFMAEIAKLGDSPPS
ncbi:MAG: hypothetical protein JRH01_06535 [Deltaproteobacteria bacterium]|nr:hypothetical protein [Deltaproteobacteria bacterium]MBW2395008.1 hypothetical protein [Deltaproteobacteria bacterium]